MKHMNFYHAVGVPFAFWEADFHKIKGKETLSISHNDLNTTDNTGLNENFSISTELCKLHRNLKICV
jgi:hypothetical protein